MATKLDYGLPCHSGSEGKDGLKIISESEAQSRPAVLQDCYKLMCIVAPEIAQYSDGIQTLQSETAARKATSKEKEEQLASQNLPLFEQIQASYPFLRLLPMTTSMSLHHIISGRM